MRVKSNKLALRVLSTATFLAMVSSCATAAFAGTYYMEDGSISIVAKTDGNYITQGTTINDQKDAGETVITNHDSETASKNTVTIKAEEDCTANVTLDNVNIDASDTGKAAIHTEGNVTLELDGDNTLTGGEGHAALEKYSTAPNNVADENYTLTLQDETTGDGKTGSLTANGGAGGAGIGGGDGSADSYSSALGKRITITGEGTSVTATGGAAGGAGIGGGQNGQGYRIDISGGVQVEATGGAGIGGGTDIFGYGCGGVGSNITISGGTVNAVGGRNSAGIGGGDGAGCSDITISGGTVTASSEDGAAGIGGGRWAGAGTADSAGVTITNGTVTANGGAGAAGIGDGANNVSDVGSVISITGGTVTANGGAGEAAGIGNGENDANDAAVNISATTARLDVTAVTQGSDEAITGGDDMTMAELNNQFSGVVRFFRGTNHYNTVHNGKYVGMADNNADEHQETDAHIWGNTEIIRQATPTEQGIVRHHCAVDGCKGYYEEFFDYVAPAEPVTPAPTDPDTPDVPGTSDSTPGTPAQGTPADAAAADAVPGAATAEEVSVTPSGAQTITAAALPKTGVNWLAAVGSAISGMVLLAAGYVLDRRNHRMN